MTNLMLNSNVFSRPLLFVSIMFFFVLSSCEKQVENSGGQIPEGWKPKGWQVLTNYESLGNVSSATIKLTAKVAGYPQFNDQIDYPISVYKIVYKTTYKSEPILASGIVSFPSNMSEDHPLLIVGNGLIFANEDAPSEFDLPDNFTGFEFIASFGYVVFLPDMIGFGESKDLLFPIHNYECSSRTMVDFIKAGTEFIESKHVQITDKKFLVGYSQGAHIALSTLKKIEEDTTLNIKVTATAVGAGGFNLEYLLNYSISKNSYSAPCHLAMLFSSYNTIYDWNRPLSDFFQEPYADEIPNLIGGEYNQMEIDEHLPRSFDSLLNPDFLNNLKNKSEIGVINALRENSIYDWAPATPLKIIHSISDERIPITDSEETYNTMIANGSTSVEFIPLNSSDHFNSAFDFVEIVLDWFKSME